MSNQQKFSVPTMPTSCPRALPLQPHAHQLLRKLVCPLSWISAPSCIMVSPPQCYISQGSSLQSSPVSTAQLQGSPFVDQVSSAFIYLKRKFVANGCLYLIHKKLPNRLAVASAQLICMISARQILGTECSLLIYLHPPKL